MEKEKLQYTNTFIYNPYMVYFESDGSVIGIVDCQNKVLTREMMQAVIDHATHYLTIHETNLQVDDRNRQIEEYFNKNAAELNEKKRAEMALKRAAIDARDIYLIKDVHRGCYKIGVAKNAEIRFNQLKTANAGIEMVRVFKGVAEDERLLHKHFKQNGKHINGEWFSLDSEDFKHIETFFNR